MASGDAEDGRKKVYPHKFGVKADRKVLDANGNTTTLDKGYYTLSFTMEPRPAMDLLKDYQSSLSPWSEATGLSDGVKQDLVRACIKPIASSICVVPILVFAWADLDHRRRNIHSGLSLEFHLGHYAHQSIHLFVLYTVFSLSLTISIFHKSKLGFLSASAQPLHTSIRFAPMVLNLATSTLANRFSRHWRCFLPCACWTCCSSFRQEVFAFCNQCLAKSTNRSRHPCSS